MEGVSIVLLMNGENLWSNPQWQVHHCFIHLMITRIVTELLVCNTGGMHVAEKFKDIGQFEEILSCSLNAGSISISNPSAIKGKNILICEDTVISGKTIHKIVHELDSFEVGDVKIFSLMMRKNSNIIPNIFVFETEEDTRVYFPWSDYPIRTYKRYCTEDAT